MKTGCSGNHDSSTPALQLTMLRPSYFGFASNNKIAVAVGKSGEPSKRTFETSTLWNIPASRVAATNYQAMSPSLKGFLDTLRNALARQLSRLDLDTSCPYINRPYWDGGSSGCSSDCSEHTGSHPISEVPSSHGDKRRIYTLYCGAIRYLHDDDCVIGGKKSPALIGKWTSSEKGGSHRGYHVSHAKKAIWYVLKYIYKNCLLYTSPSPRDRTRSRMPSSA